MSSEYRTRHWDLSAMVTIKASQIESRAINSDVLSLARSRHAAFVRNGHVNRWELVLMRTKAGRAPQPDGLWPFDRPPLNAPPGAKSAPASRHIVMDLPRGAHRAVDAVLR
jgi:hypothetical protein